MANYEEQCDCGRYTDHAPCPACEIKQLRAENQRLREALESIALCRCPGANEPVCVHEIAKKALEVSADD